MSKITGYIIMLVGVLVALASFLKQATSFLPASIKTIYITILGIIIIALGFWLSSSSGSGRQASKEVPIYQGNKVVGYRQG